MPQNKDPYTEGPLTSDALKFLSSRMSHYACWTPFSYSELHIFAQKKRGHVAPLSGSSVTDLYYVSMPSNHTLFSNIFSK
jgi:hypothetical protein